MAMVASNPVMSYEEARKQRVEENKKRMEELGLFDMSKSLKAVKKDALVRKPPLNRRKTQWQEFAMEARRSSRNSGKPAVSYRDQLDLLPGMRMRCGTRDRQPLARRYLSDAARMAAVDAAEEVYKDIKNPSFVKPMLHSHTASGFWLGLPANFCKEYMPHCDEKIMLEDEQKMEWECVYLANKAGLSGGWRGFSLDHELVDGDSCVFELVKPRRFKVYIFRCEEQYEGGEEADPSESGGDVIDKDTATEKKKTGKTSINKAPASAPAALAKPRKLGTSSVRKLDLEDEEEEGEEGNGDYPNASKKVKKEVDTDVAAPSRSSKRTRVREEDGDSEVPIGHKRDVRSKKQKDEEPEEVIELDSEIDDEGAYKPASHSKDNQAGIRPFGRITRNAAARSLQK